MKATMLTVAGKRFRCNARDGDEGPCEANVFTKLEDPEYGTIYRCNACGTEYHDPS